ncbi:MAG TPA: ABC transporter ATP-binding protein [Candidatus Bipolaricaulota bacterium]
MDALNISKVHKSYHRGWGRPRTDALQGVSLHVGAGQIFGLLGPNGAGKTTLIKCMMDLTRPDRGQIELLGVSARMTRARARVGYLPEDYQLPDYLSGEQFLQFVGGLYGLPTSLRARRVDQTLEQVELTTRRKDKIKTYSKGMRQRLGLAHALLAEPRLLVLDEPNEGLDPLGRAQVKALLLELKRGGVTVFISSHVLTEVERICDRVAILHEGRLLKEGTVEELTQHQDLEQRFVEIIHEAEQSKPKEGA